jgi:hypothetical protein
MGTLLLASLAGCGAAPDSALDGVGAQSVLDASDVNLIGTSNSLAVVEDLQVLEGGDIWALNSTEPYFVGFTADGSVLHEYGTRGGGPREFGRPSGFVSGGTQGEAWIFDQRRHALIRVSDPERAWSEVLLPRDSVPAESLISGFSLVGTQVRTARLGHEIVLPRSTGSLAGGMFSFTRSIWGADLLGLDPASGAVRNILSLGQILGDPSEAFEATDQPPQLLLWFRLWDVCSGTEIRVFDRLRNQIRRFDVDGDELEAMTLPPVRVHEVTPDQFARALFDLYSAEVTGGVGRRLSAGDSSSLIRRVAQEWNRQPAELAAILPRYVDLRCAADGTVWMRPFDPEAGGLRGGLVWIRIRPDTEAQEISFPSGFDPFRFTPARIWGVQRDELDVATIAWVAVPEG